MTVISVLPQQKPLANYTDISILGNEGLPVLRISKLTEIKRSKFEMYGTAHLVAGIADISCKTLLTHPDVRKLAQGNNSYDIILIEVFHSNCHNGLARKFKAPVIGKN